MSRTLSDHFVEVADLRLHYLAAGEGDPVLLLHGWPTSSHLWRNVIGPIAKNYRVIALDLPGFGQSDKPLDVSYSFRYFERVLSGFLDSLEIDRTSLVVHDLGGPIGLYWACQNSDRLDKLALLNTLVYPEVSWAVVLFVTAIRLPIVRSVMASPWGLKMALRIGIHDRSRLTNETIRAFQAPFETQEARRALLKAGCNLSGKGFVEIAQWLTSLEAPLCGIYGERDRILPDIARTMKRVQNDVPHAKVTPMRDCGHFLQEERPEHIGRLLTDFLDSS